MGKRGPAPKPTALRILHGDKPSRINRNEPQPRNMPPEKPAYLTPRAAQEWDRVMPDLIAMGTVKAADQAALAAYCESVALSAQISAAMAEDGLLVTGPDGTGRRHPLAGAWKAAGAEVRAWSHEFGLTPSARSELRAAPAGAPGDRLLS
jgi:P27 family predicted phage terminase small subunit